MDVPGELPLKALLKDDRVPGDESGKEREAARLPWRLWDDR